MWEDRERKERCEEWLCALLQGPPTELLNANALGCTLLGSVDLFCPAMYMVKVYNLLTLTSSLPSWIDLAASGELGWSIRSGLYDMIE